MKASYVFIVPHGQPHVTKLPHVFPSLSCPPHSTGQEHRTVGCEDGGSIYLPLFRTFGKIVDPYFVSVFLEETFKAVGPFYAVSMQSEGKGPTLGNGNKICRVLSKYRQRKR